MNEVCTLILSSVSLTISAATFALITDIILSPSTAAHTIAAIQEGFGNNVIRFAMYTAEDGYCDGSESRKKQMLEDLKRGVEDNDCSRGGNCIIMDPSTGNILAMASYPYYDLNDPYTVTSYYADDWDDLEKEDYLIVTTPSNLNTKEIEDYLNNK